MKICTLLLKPDVSVVPVVPCMDGPQTLVLAFFASELALQPAPLQLLRTTFPQSYILGCSTAEEILGATLEDHSVTVAILNFSSTRLCIV